MKIEKIKKTKSGKYKIEFDNEEDLLTYDDVILNKGLLFQHQIDSNLFYELCKDTKYYDIYHKVVSYISKRLRSEMEIDLYLEKNQVTKEDQEKIKKDLKKTGLLNDTFFAQAYFSDKFHLTSAGPYKIKKELLEHRIEEEVIDSLVFQVSKEELEEKLTKLLKKRVEQNKKSARYVLEQKLLYEFTNLGYERELINQVLSSLKGNEKVPLEEYKKIYEKLNKKYTGEELKQRVMAKMYQKGFCAAEIDSCKGEFL